MNLQTTRILDDPNGATPIPARRRVPKESAFRAHAWGLEARLYFVKLGAKDFLRLLGVLIRRIFKAQ
jgi:hypothetical protein